MPILGLNQTELVTSAYRGSASIYFDGMLNSSDTQTIPAPLCRSACDHPAELEDKHRLTLLHVIELLDSVGIKLITIAGGAPRDLYFNSLGLPHAKCVEDFDFYITSPYPHLSLKDALEPLGFKHVVQLNSNDYDNEEMENSSTPSIRDVLYATYNNLEFNFIVHDEGTTKESIINNFSCSLSKFELDIYNFRVNVSKEALLSLITNTIIFKEGTLQRYKYKITSYFPSFTVGTYQQAAIALIDLELSKHPKIIDI